MPNDAPVVDSAAPATTAAPAPAPEAAASTPEPTAAPEGAPPEGEQAPKPEESPKPRLFTQEELNRAARRERKAAEARTYERVRLEMENQQLRQQLGQQRGDKPTDQGTGERPRPENFKDWDAYNEALVDWKVDQRERSKAEAVRVERSTESFDKYASEVRSTLLKEAELYEDFEERITAPGVVFTDAMVDALIRTEKPAAVAIFLADHPQESQRIGALPLAAQVREIDKIAATITKPPAPSKAPEPIKPNAGSAAGVEQTLESTANNYQDWLKVRRRQLAQTGR